MTIVMGFGGMRWHDELVSFRPQLPEAWTFYTFRLVIGDSTLEFSVNRSEVSVKKVSGPPAAIELYEREVRLASDEPVSVAIESPSVAAYVRGALFDLDGVLVHTDKFHYQAWKSLADEEGIEFDETINHRLRGVSRQESLEIVLERAGRTYDRNEKLAMMDRKNRRFQELVDTLTPNDLLPGVRELLENLRAAGWKLGVCSSSKNAQTICSRLEILELFDGFVGGDAITHTKPDPEIFIKGAKSLGLMPGDCVVFEDAQAGIDAAKTAGVAAVGICTKDRMLRGSDLNVESVAQVTMKDLDEI